MTDTPASSDRPFALDETACPGLAERFPFEDDDEDGWDHTAFLLVETAIENNVICGPVGLAVDRLADSNGALDGYAVLVDAVPDYWLRSQIKRAHYYATSSGEPDAAAILRDVTSTANRMLSLFRENRTNDQQAAGGTQHGGEPPGTLNVPDPAVSRRAGCPGELPLYARPHSPVVSRPNGKCDVCGRYRDESIHAGLDPATDGI